MGIPRPVWLAGFPLCFICAQPGVGYYRKTEILNLKALVLDHKHSGRVKWVENIPSESKEDGERMAIVTVNQGESIESALRRFKRKVMTEEIIKDAKKHAFFIPPGQKAKLKSALARKRNKKKGRMRSTPRD